MNSRPHSKKGQTELMGLAIVVILIALAFAFVVRFVILKEPSTDTQSYRESELAANFMNTLLETNAPECSNARFSTLFQDCANQYADGGRIVCSTLPESRSCEYLRSQTALLFDRTLGTWKQDYSFQVSRDVDHAEDTAFSNLWLGSPCLGDRRVKIQPLPLEQGTLYLALYLCS